MREHTLVSNAIEKFGLNLSGKVVYTEAASGSYFWTALTAALGGADKVYALASGSRYASLESVVETTNEVARKLGVEDRIHVCTRKEAAHLAQADIVTNLGFVRPISAEDVECMKSGAVISLMWEPWEFRHEDIDLEACLSKGIPIVGTNEAHPGLQTYRYVAMIVAKVLLENEIEIFDTDIVLLGGSRFYSETLELLEGMGARVHSSDGFPVARADAIVCLEHERGGCLVGPGGRVEFEPGGNVPLVVHVCGNVDVEYIRRFSGRIIPEIPAGTRYMSFTTGHVGPKPIIDLNAAGLRVGQAWLDKDEETLAALALPLGRAGKSVLDRK